MNAKQFSQTLGIMLASIGSTGFAWAGLGDTSSLVGAIRLGEPVMAGTGCPRGSTEFIVDSDAEELFMLFNDFVAEAGGRGGKRLDRKACLIAIPIRVPSGYSVAVPELRLKGFAALPEGATATVKMEHFFAGTRGPVLERVLRGAREGRINVDSSVLSDVWSPCGEDVTLRTNIAVTLRTNAAREQAVVGFVKAENTERRGYAFRLKFRRCEVPLL